MHLLKNVNVDFNDGYYNINNKLTVTFSVTCIINAIQSLAHNRDKRNIWPDMCEKLK